MNIPAQNAQTFVTKTGIGYEVHLTTDGVIGKHVLTLLQPYHTLGTKLMLNEKEMEAVAIAAADALSQIKRG
jgi:hypothetical protein